MASSALIAALSDDCSAVCPGHVLYGLTAVNPEVGDSSAFTPVLKSIKCRLIHVASHPAGSALGVGGSFSLPSGSTCGVVPMGLNDGYRNPARDGEAMMLVRGTRARVLGVSLEHTILDLTNVVGAEVGGLVTVLGDDGDDVISLENVSDWQDTQPIAVLMSFSERMPRRYC
jgi:alanine racemase